MKIDIKRSKTKKRKINNIERRIIIFSKYSSSFFILYNKPNISKRPRLHILNVFLYNLCINKKKQKEKKEII